MFRTAKRFVLSTMIASCLMYAGDAYNVSRPIDAFIEGYYTTATIVHAAYEKGPKGLLEYIVNELR